MDPVHRAKVELGYTRTMKDRMEKRHADKMASYTSKIKRLEAVLASAGTDGAERAGRR